MRLRVFVGVWACCLAVLSFTAQPLSAQQTRTQQTAATAPVAAASTPATGETEIAELLDRAQRLESERRWGEALTIYEDGHRQYPAARHIEQRLQLCRIHYDLARRYT